MNQIKKHQGWGYLLLLASLACIFTATLSPFDFVVPEVFSGNFLVEEFNFGSSITDYLQNVLLFIPLGISLFIITVQKHRNIWLVLIICCLISVIISTMIEMTQLFLPIRVSNLTDIIYNTCGGVVGGLLYCWHRSVFHFIACILTGRHDRLSWRSLQIAIACHCTIVVLSIWILLNSVNLSNWDDDYYLAMGNEVTGDRPWNGFIHNLYICDKLLNKSEVVQAFEQADTFFPRASGLITALNFSDKQEHYQDSREKIPDLQWQKTWRKTTSSSPIPPSKVSHQLDNQKTFQQPGGILLNQNQWLKTKEKASFLSSRLKQTGEFSLFLTVATKEINLTGPARIISLSEGIHAQNIHIAQEGISLNFRVRTPTTGSDASQPQFSVPHVFNNDSLQQILITFAQSKISFYINHPDNLYLFEFSPDNTFLSFLPWKESNWVVDVTELNILKYRVLFYLIIFIPLAIFLSYLVCKKLNVAKSVHRPN